MLGVRTREALIIEAGGERFRFYYDLEHVDVLHITLRHGTVPMDAIQTFFDGETRPWDEARSRFETVTETRGLYWTRHPTTSRSSSSVASNGRMNDA
jgi:hypothetical protein